MHHIKNTLPEIRNKITTSLSKYQSELASLGGTMGEQNPSNVVLGIITEFCADYRTVIDGNSNDLSVNELSGGARIAFVFHELFSNGVKSVDPFDQVKDGDIRTILYNASVRASSACRMVVIADGRDWTGLVAGAVRRHDGVRGHCQAADPETRGTGAQVCQPDLRRAHPDPHPTPVQERQPSPLPSEMRSAALRRVCDSNRSSDTRRSRSGSSPSSSTSTRRRCCRRTSS